jgi:hypothetical protein
MTDLTPLARQLVEAGAIRWEAGMLTAGEARLVVVHVDGSAEWAAKRDEPAPMLPDLEDPATAALLAVRAMERGALFAPSDSGWEWSVFRDVPADTLYDGQRVYKALAQRGECPTLGEAAARALLALAQPKETA